MSTKNVTLKEKVNGALGDTIFPATTSPNVYDSAKSQALSQTLVDTPDYEALGYAKFSTASAYSTADKVYYSNELYRFTADKSAGEWDSAKVEHWSVEQDIEAYDEAIRSLIPAQASADNKLADKEYVNDKVSTDTATFRGTFNLVTDLELTTEATQGQIATALGTAISGEDKNDYAFVQIPTSDATPTEIARIDRYKYTGLQWAFEYSLNNSGFTAEQWAAINSGITSSLVTAFGAKYDKPSSGIPVSDMDTSTFDAAPTENSVKPVKSSGILSAIASAVMAVKSWVTDLFAKKDGYYSQMTAGAAENLVGQTPDKEAYLMRPTGGESNEVANGIASVVGAEGNSCVWNQLVQNGDFSDGTTGWSTEFNSGSIAAISVNDNILTISRVYNPDLGAIVKSTSITSVVGHKYFVRVDVKKENTLPLYIGFLSISGVQNTRVGITTSSQLSDFITLSGVVVCQSSSDVLSIRFGASSTLSGEYINVQNFIAFDLTLLGIDNLTTTAQVEAWLAQHVGTKPYYAYNAGEILSAKMIGMRTVGRNLLNPETKQATLIPYTWADNSNVFVVKNVPSGATATYTPDNTGEAVSVDVSGGSLDITNYGSGVLELSAATAETYVCYKWDGTKDNDVVPFEDHTQDFDVRKVYGKVSGAGEYVQCFPDGMRGAGSVHDTLNGNEAVVKINSRNLGGLTWNKLNNYFYTNIGSSQPNFNYEGLCARYPKNKQATPQNKTWQNNAWVGSNINLIITDDGYTDTTTFKAAMNGVMLYYELATPIVYTDLVYRDGGIDTPLSEVLINIEVDNWGTEQQLVTPYEDGNPTSIPATLSTIYSMDAVEAIDTLQKTTYTETEVHDNLAAMLACVNTNCSEVLGGTFAVSDTATDKVFDFSFTANPEP